MNNHTHHHNGSIVLKVTATITVIFLVAITLNQIILNRHINDTIEENMEETVLRTAEQTENYLSTRVSGSIERLLYFKAESGLDSILANYFANPNAAAYSVAMSNLAAPLSTKKVSDSLISDLYLYTDYGAFTDGSTLLTPGFSLEKVALWSEIREGNSFLEFCTVRNDEIFRSRKWVVPVLYRFSISSAQVYSATRKCILVVNLDCKEIQALIRKIVPEAESAILVLDQEGNPVTCVNAAAEELMREPELLSRLTAAKNTVLDVRLDGKRYYGVARKVSVTPWTIVCLQASTTAREESRSYLQLLLVEGGTLIMVTGIVCLLMLHWFTAPLRELINCQNVRQEFCYEGNDEIALLTKSYNQMLRSSNEMLDREKQYSHQLEEKNDAIELEQRLKRRAELQALQAQINPHFLYNTLDSIRWKAEAAGAEDISQMVRDLANFFRIGLSRGREIIPLEQVICHVRSYLDIQKMRYGDRLDYQIRIPEELKKLYTVKLLIQPLAENSIYHGIKESDRKGTILITAGEEPGGVYLCVRDDGLGISQETLTILNADLKRGVTVSDGGYGIFNVNERIRLYFGRDYGLELRSCTGEWTEAVIHLPKYIPERTEWDVSDFDRR